MAYIYGIRAKDSDAYFYIGSTAKAVRQRLKAHLTEVRLGCHCNRHFANKVKSIGAANVVIDLIEECDAKDRYEREYHWIQQYLTDGVKLTNILTAPFTPVLSESGNLCERLGSLDIYNALLTYDYGEPRTGDKRHDFLSDMLEGVSAALFEHYFNDLLAAIPVIVEKEVPQHQVEAGIQALYQQIVGIMPEMYAET